MKLQWQVRDDQIGFAAPRDDRVEFSRHLQRAASAWRIHGSLLSHL
jgi:hypothetical protein